MYFGKSRLRKIWLDKCPKSCVLEDLQTDNMANGWKHFYNLNDSTFRIFTLYCECGCIEKSLF